MQPALQASPFDKKSSELKYTCAKVLALFLSQQTQLLTADFSKADAIHNMRLYYLRKRTMIIRIPSFPIPWDWYEGGGGY
jgi:hypothetical protein